MKRRDFVRIIAAVPAAATSTFGQQTVVPPQPATATASTQGSAVPPALGGRTVNFTAPPITSAVPDAVAETETHFFTGSQLAALRKLSETLMPPFNGYPGAVEAGTPEFLDFLVGVSPADRQQIYQSGLDRLNADAKKQFGKALAEAALLTARECGPAGRLGRARLRTRQAQPSRIKTQPSADVDATATLSALLLRLQLRAVDGWM